MMKQSQYGVFNGFGIWLPMQRFDWFPKRLSRRQREERRRFHGYSSLAAWYAANAVPYELDLRDAWTPLKIAVVYAKHAKTIKIMKTDKRFKYVGDE